jgi:HD-GYP domain-containing protein (c-di-GMP phosphodiesterase class II)
LGGAVDARSVEHSAAAHETPHSLAGVALGAGEPLEGRVRALLAGRFELRRAAAELRLIGPVEFEREGVRSLRRHRLRAPGVPAIVIAAAPVAAECVRGVFREGAVALLFEDELDTRLLPELAAALERRGRGRAQEREARDLAAELGRRARELECALERLRQSYDQTLAALVHALDWRERETACHSQRVAAYAVMLGLRAGMPEAELEDLYRGSLLHDLGKIGIPDSILLKPGGLDPGEWDVMRGHAERGAEILDRISFLRSAAPVPRAHHEAWDGSGYPLGLIGEQIPLQARVFAVVDIYDALRSERPYKQALAHAEALAELARESGRRLDPQLGARFASEPEETWRALADLARQDPSFEQVVATCRTRLEDAR